MIQAMVQPRASQFGSKQSTNLNFQSLGMAGLRLEPDLADKESLLPPESRMQLEMPEQVGDGGVFWGTAHTGSSGQAPVCMSKRYPNNLPS